jgi:hypothetical protein
MKFKLDKKNKTVNAIFWCENANGPYVKEWVWIRGRLWIACEGCRTLWKTEEEEQYNKSHQHIVGITKL